MSRINIKYVNWHVGSQNPWFGDFEVNLQHAYRFDTGAWVGSSILEWQLDFMEPMDRTLLLADIARVVRRYNLMTALSKRHEPGDTLEIYLPRREAAFTGPSLMERLERLPS